MGVAIPLSYVEDRASGALVVDGALRFDSTKSHYLSKSIGNITTFTISYWMKRCGSSRDDTFVTESSTGFFYYVNTDGSIRINNNTSNIFISNGLYRDPSSWYHIVINNNGSTFNLYVNGILDKSASISTQLYSGTLLIGRDRVSGAANHANFYLSNVYFIDGQALDPSYFGYTDPLTNTWRPKKLSSSVAFGTNGFYLPFDGSAPIGQDQSGRGNNWTPVNFGGSNTLEKATGALSILNTDGGGKTAQVGVLGSRAGATFTVTVASAGGGNRYFIDGVQQASLSFIRGATYTFDQSAASNSGHPLLFSTSQDGSTYSDGVTTSGTPGSSGAYTKITVPHNSADTLYYKCGVHSGMGGSISVTTDERKADLYAWKNVLALPLVGIKSDFSNTINSGTSNKSITANGNAAASSAQSNFYGGSFYFDGNGTTGLTVTYTSDFDCSGTFTSECWVYGTQLGNYNPIICQWSSDGTGTDAWTLETVGTALRLYVTDLTYIEDPVPFALNRWQHFAVVYNGGTLSLYRDGVLVGSASKTISASTLNYTVGRFHNNEISGQTWYGYIQDVRHYKGLAKYTQNFIPASTDPDILPDTPSGVAYSSNVALVPSTDGAVTTTDAGNSNLSIAESEDFNFGTGDFTIEGYFYINSSGSNNCIFDLRDAGSSSQYFLRMTSATAYDFRYGGSLLGTFAASDKVWNHIAISRSSGTTKIFVNGLQTNSFSDTNNASNTGPLIISSFNDTTGSSSSFGFNGFLSNLHVVKGTALYTSNFTPPSAPITSVANTKLLCCKSNSSATAFDVSPGTITANGNAAATNFNPFTVNINTQRGQESGYATLNPLANPDGTLSNGNLTWSSTTTQDSACASTIYVNSGKWYWEITDVTGTGALNVGISKDNDNLSPTPGTTAGGYYYLASAYKYNNNNISVYGSTWTTGDVISAALNMDAGTVTFYKNGVSQGVAYSGLSGYFSPSIGDGGQSTAASGSINFGQKPFKFPPPAGFQPLALANTPRPTIVRPDQYVGVSTWSGAQSGSGGLTRQISLGMQPDFVWIKQRNQAYSTGHQLYDSVRGAGAEKELNSSGTAAEGAGNIETYGWLNSFDKTGFTVKGGSSDYDYVDKSGVNYVAWAWKAGGNSNTYNINDVGYATASAAGLTAGTITPTGASVNTKSGFSIITYTGNGTSGATVSHGLGNTPGLLIVKRRSSTGSTANWAVWHSSLTAGYNLFLNSNDNAQAYSPSRFTSTIPTSTVFSLGSGDETNYSGGTFVSYLWTEIPGFSKFGSVTLSASSNDAFIWTGFRPRWFLLKGTGSTSNWIILDSIRDPFNFVDNELFANLSNTENAATSTYSFDFLSNGVKCRNQGLTGGFIYAAFAETPSFNLYGGQSNAR